MSFNKQDCIDYQETGISSIDDDIYVCEICMTQELYFILSLSEYNYFRSKNKCFYCSQYMTCFCQSDILGHLMKCLSFYYCNENVLPSYVHDEDFDSPYINVMEILDNLQLNCKQDFHPNFSERILEMLSVKDCWYNNGGGRWNGFSEHQQYMISWDRFSNFIKHERRYFFHSFLVLNWLY